MIQQSVNSLLYRVKNQDNQANRISPSIYMVPSVLRDVSPSSFKPRMVSIGPLHREDEDVQAFEQQKASYLSILMSRINSPQEEILKSCMQKAYASMKEIKACYVWTKTYSDAKIAEMMVMDACFILGFMLKIWEYDNKSYSGRLLQVGSVLHDMVLLENQIPIFFLNKIFQCTILKFEPNASLVELIHQVYLTYNLFNVIKTDNISIDTTHHILGLIHQCYAPDKYFTDIKSGSFSNLTHSAVNLNRAGVNFKPNQKPTWSMQMEVETSRFPYFCGSWSRPNFRMPILKVHDYTEMLLRNLIAYEQSFPTANYVTSNAIAMDMLVNTHDDVAKLVDSGVLVNIMGSNEEAASMINSICKNVSCVEFFYKEQWETLNNYCNNYWPKHIAKMRSTYFSSPWSMIALIAGIVLFVLTVVQTIFTVKPAGTNE